MTFVCIHLLLGLSYIKLKNLNLLCSYTESRAYNMIWKNHNLILYDTLFLYLWNHIFRWQKALVWHIYTIKQITEYVCKLLFKGRKMSIVYNCLYAFLRTNFSLDMQHSLMALNLMGPNTLYAFIMSFNANRNCRLRNYVSSECYCIRI